MTLVKRTVLLQLPLVVAACADVSPPAVAADTGGESVTSAPADTSSTPADATEFVRMLLVEVSDAGADSLDRHVDREFAERLASNGELVEILRPFDPTRCTLDEGPGYGAVAIPPPMDEPEEEAARIEAIIEELQASTEVIATCVEMETYQDEADDPPTEHEVREPLFAISVRRERDGSFRVLAWRAFADDIPGNW